MSIFDRKQLELGYPTRGGRRNGAGRKPGLLPRIRHRSRDGVAAAHPALVTLKVRPGLPSLRRRSLIARFERSLAALRPRSEFRVVEYSIQSNHAHFVIEAANARELGRGMKALGARFARVVNRALGSRGGRIARRGSRRSHMSRNSPPLQTSSIMVRRGSS